MKRYIFDTTPTTKEADREKWFICHDMVKPMSISADDLNDAIRKYAEVLENEYGISISNNAIRNKQPMYSDFKDGTTLQVGYVLTGKTGFDNGGRGYIDRYIDLWVGIKEYTYPEFKEAE